MEVHPPHHAIDSWRDFFVHMATICLGLLIAIGLEQSVEAIHHHLQKNDLEQALDRDAVEAIVDAQSSQKAADISVTWSLARMNAVRAALASSSPLQPAPPPPYADFDVPDDPAFKAAKASGGLDLLSQEDIRAWSEADGIFAVTEKAYEDMQNARLHVRMLEQEFEGPAGPPDFSKATPAELHRYLDLLDEELWSASRYRSWCLELRGLEFALDHGTRDFDALHKAERSLRMPIPALKAR